MQYPAEVEVVEVIIEADTSAFEAAIKAPVVLSPIRRDAFEAELRWINQTLGVNVADVQAFVAATGSNLTG